MATCAVGKGLRQRVPPSGRSQHQCHTVSPKRHDAFSRRWKDTSTYTGTLETPTWTGLFESMSSNWQALWDSKNALGPGTTASFRVWRVKGSVRVLQHILGQGCLERLLQASRALSGIVVRWRQRLACLLSCLLVLFCVPPCFPTVLPTAHLQGIPAPSKRDASPQPEYKRQEIVRCVVHLCTLSGQSSLTCSKLQQMENIDLQSCELGGAHDGPAMGPG